MVKEFGKTAHNVAINNYYHCESVSQQLEGTIKERADQNAGGSINGRGHMVTLYM